MPRIYPASVGRKKDARPARTIINQILNDEKDLCKDIIDDLLANGQDELKLVESVGNLEYDYEGRHPAPATPRTASTRSETSKVATTSSSIRAYVESSFNLSAVSAGTVCSFTGFSDCKDINGNIIY